MALWDPGLGRRPKAGPLVGRALSPLPCCLQGVRLLSYLYQEALDNCSNEHYPVLLSLLQTSCEPYTRCGPALFTRLCDRGLSSGSCWVRGGRCEEGTAARRADRRLTAPHPGRFIHDWVYSGLFRDTYGEFMIQVNHEYLGFRGRRLRVAGLGLCRQVAQGRCLTAASRVSCPTSR